jgi:hypothetical protein
MDEAAGSIPVTSTKFPTHMVHAEAGERPDEIGKAAGSIPFTPNLIRSAMGSSLEIIQGP